MHASIWYTKGGNEKGQQETKGGKMEQELAYLIGLFVTRIVLPVVITFYLGYRLERVLNRDQASQRP